jgi:NAD(P)-dependent dehydrogenase (short-subunit alcohol dehydrogenase family)
MKDFRGRVAAITGAASGIGRHWQRHSPPRAQHWLCATWTRPGSTKRWRAVASGPADPSVTSSLVDVADWAAVHAWAERVAAEHGRVNLVVNNAGVALGATVESMRYEDFEWLIGIDFWGVVHGTKAFLPT